MNLKTILLFFLTLSLFPSCDQVKSSKTESEEYARPIDDSVSIEPSIYPDYRMLDTIPKPIWMMLQKPPTQYDSIELDNLEFDEIIFDFKKIIFEDEGSKLEKKATTKTSIEADDVCLTLNNHDEVKNLFFEGLKYKKIGDIVYLQEIDFRVSENKLILDELKVDNKTTKDSLAKLFPNSFQWRNYGITWVPSILEAEESANFSFMTLKVSNRKALIRLNFLDNNLFYCDIIYECHK
ncbi:hypothetical protein [Ekhidna sp.]